MYAFLSVFGPPRNLLPRYNIAPTADADVVRLDAEGQREPVSMRWGLVPFFWKKGLRRCRHVNARAETVSESRSSATKRRRCIVPASGFFEWTGEKGGKQPHLFSAADGSPILAFASLWDRWVNPETQEELLSCTSVVSGASEWMKPYHDRMPVLLTGSDIDACLKGSLGQDEFQPSFGSALREWPVSKRVNRTGVGDDDPTIVEPERPHNENKLLNDKQFSWH